jgi:hypothetical protein
MGTHLNSMHTNSYQNSNNMAAIFYIYSQIYKKPYITPKIRKCIHNSSEFAYITPRLLPKSKKCIHNSHITPSITLSIKNGYITPRLLLSIKK